MGVTSSDKGRSATLKENQKQTEDNTNLTTYENEEDGYISAEMQFDSLMTEFFEGSDINNLIQLCLDTSRHKPKILSFLRVVFHWIK